MSKQNVEIVRLCYELLSNRDFSRAPELWDPDVVLDNSRLVFNPDVYRGYAGLERWAGAVEAVWDDLRLVPRELIDGGEYVVGAPVQGKGKGSGVEVTMQAFAVWALRDSKVVRVAGGYRDRLEALEAAGLSEKDVH
jgi:ketosteroid isomerase-like protein